MERIDIELSGFSQRSRSFAVSHLASGLQRGLDHGEQVVVRDTATGEHYTAAVVEIGFEPEDTTYRLELGTRITAGEAAEWLATGPVTPADGRVTTQELVELLAELREGRRRLRDAIEREG